MRLLSIYLSFFRVFMILFALSALLLICSGCRKGSPILPVIPPPDGVYMPDPSSRGYYPKQTASRETSNVRMIITGPSEYLASELEPKLITNSMPTFTVRLDGDFPELKPEYFNAKIDNEKVQCTVDNLTGEVSFTPPKSLLNDYHFATLRYSNPVGLTQSVFLSFRINAEPSRISAVFWSEKEDLIAVFFDSEVEIKRLIDTSRWKINGETDFLRGKININLGGFTVFLPIKQEIYREYTEDRPLSISFNDATGLSDYVISRGGGSIRENQLDNCFTCDEIHEDDCKSITADIFAHNSIETEPHAVGYHLDDTEHTCCKLKVVIDGWQLYPVANGDPTLDYYQETDPLQRWPLYIIDPLYMVIADDNYKWSKTFSLSRLFQHDIRFELFADCDHDDVFETSLGFEYFNLLQGAGVDTQPPDFTYGPTVLYGDEAADIIEQLVGDNPMSPEQPPAFTPNTEYYFAIERGEFVVQMAQLRENACDLYIVAEAKDDYGRNNPSHFCLDKMTTTGPAFGTIGGGAGNDILVCDIYPFGSIISEEDCESNCTHCELDCDWPDSNCYSQTPLLCTIGNNYRQDWCGEEKTIVWWNLSDILLGNGGEDITEIRVRVVDSASDPFGGYSGNWRRSDNVLDQLCSMEGEPERGGSLIQLAPCQSRAHVEYVAKNPREYVPPGEEWKWKFVAFDYPCNDRKTNFIYPMGDISNSYFQWSTDWGTEIMVAVLLENTGLLKIYPCSEPDYIKISVSSLEVGNTGHLKGDAGITAVKYDNFPGPKPSLERLKQLFGYGPLDFLCDCKIYLGVFLVSDDIDANTDTLFDAELFVSSRDHRMPEDNRKDLAITFSDSLNEGEQGFWERIQYEGNLNYGQVRGVGAGGPDIEKEQWYGYDDYIKRGGFENIQITRCTNPEDANKMYPLEKQNLLPIQSEADVMIIEAHTSYRDGYPFPIFSPFIYPLHHYWLSSWGPFSHYDAKYYSAYPDTYTQPDKPVKHNDFAPPDEYFWKKFSSPIEMKWLVIFSCGSVSFKGPYSPGDTWISRINENYIQSVCGFSEKIGGIKSGLDFDSTGFFLGEYTRTLSEFIDGICPPDPNGYYYKNPNLYEDYKFNHGSNDFSKDPSIAAFMETAVNQCRFIAAMRKSGCTSASGITKEGTIFWVWKIEVRNGDPNEALDPTNTGYYIKKVSP